VENLNFIKNNKLLIVGHYGVGKTNISVNLAFKLKKTTPKKVTLIDLDIVNPFFRSYDNVSELNKADISTIYPPYAGTNVDVPSISAEVQKVFTNDDYAIFDIGGDDSGSIVLNTYKPSLEECGYDMFAVINMYRPYISTPETAAEMLNAIELTSNLKITGIINNSNLGFETNQKTVYNSIKYAQDTANLYGVPLVATTVFKEINCNFDDIDNILYIENMTKNYF